MEHQHDYKLGHPPHPGDTFMYLMTPNYCVWCKAPWKYRSTEGGLTLICVCGLTLRSPSPISREGRWFVTHKPNRPLPTRLELLMEVGPWT